MIVKIIVFWDVASCSLVCRCQCLGGTSYVRHRGKTQTRLTLNPYFPTANILSGESSDRKCTVALSSQIIAITPLIPYMRILATAQSNSHAPSCPNPIMSFLLSHIPTHTPVAILVHSLSVLRVSYWNFSLFACLPSLFHCGHFSTRVVFE
jgi:hypothetical protein